MEAEHSKTNQVEKRDEVLGIPPFLLRVILVGLLLLGLGIRLMDLTDPPLDLTPHASCAVQ